MRQGLSSQEKHRACETLRVFNLDANGGRLRQMRKAAIAPYLDTAKALAELAEDCSVEELLPVLEGDLNSIADRPFVTAIKHTLQP